jgi:gamma-glutamyltranspeptidase/glutathione hydrolase
MASFTTRPTLRGTFGMASSTHWLATATAQSVLERGGNAFDAVVAGSFVLHVVEPENNGAGGDLVAIFATAADRVPTVLCGQGPAPAAATIEHYRAEGLDLVPGSGALAAAIPGAVDAWLLLLRDHGTWELGDVLAYAIGYARNGHPAGQRLVGVIGAAGNLFKDHWPTSREQWMPEGRVPEAGSLLRLEHYAATLDRIVEEATGPDRESRIEAAREVWRTGFVAEAIDEFVRVPHRHSTGGDHAGVLRASDLAGYSAHYEAPLTAPFRGVTVVKPGAWTQGPSMLQALGILDGFDDLDPSNAEVAHRILEATKLALADRDAYYGDGADIDWLLDPGYLAQRRALIGEQASAEFRAGGEAPWQPLLRRADGTLVTGGEAVPRPDGSTRGDTCHIAVVDVHGNIIAATASGGWLQSSPTIPGLGFCLGSRLQMNWLDESSPSRLEPGKRPRTTLSPTMLVGADGSLTALGTPGGDQQDTWQLLFVLRHVLGMDLQAAIDAPAFHTEGYVSSFYPRSWDDLRAVVEDRLGDDVLAALAAHGHAVERAGDWALGRLATVSRDASTGIVSAAANPRAMHGYAAGR